MIEININLVFTIINLIVLYLLMKKFLFGPILNVMEQRKNMIDQQFASAKDTEEQAYELKGKYEDALKSAKDESMRIVNQAKDEAKVQAERIVKDANTQAGAMLDKAKADIRTEQENAMKAMDRLPGIFVETCQRDNVVGITSELFGRDDSFGIPK